MLQGETPGRTGSACSSSTPGASDLLTVPEPSLRVSLQRLEAGAPASGILPVL